MNQPRLAHVVGFLLIFLIFPNLYLRIALADEAPFTSVATSIEKLAIVESVTGGTVARPKIVFIPGTLGSKLMKAGSDELVWGGNKFDNPDLYYDGATKLTPATFDQVSIDLIFKVFRHSIYGDALDKLRSNGEINEHDVLDFSYDWRQSNSKSADDLNAWLCSYKEALAGNRIIFVAHSMGGLVLKHWFINYYDKKIGCNYNDGTWLDVRRVFFIGTPHYGAPKALTALFEGYSLYDGNWFVNKYVSEGLNSYGFSFDSLYELLPVQNDEACNSVYGAGSGLPSAFSDTPNASDYAKIFNIDFMTAHDLPYSPLTAQKKEFREKRLDAILKKAAKFACDLAEYKFPILGLGNVTVIVGHGVTDELNNNTAAALTKTGGRWTPVRANGDGTVLRSSAEWKNIIVDDRNVEYSGSDHMELMDQPEVRLKIYRAVHAVSDGVFRAVQGDAAKFARALAMLNQQKKLFFPVPGDQASVQFANEINSRLFSLRGMTTDEVLKAASDARKGTKTDSALSYVFIEYASVPANANPIGDFFANQAAGKELLDLGYKDDALKAFSKAIETSPNVLEQAKSSNLSKELIKSLELTTSNAYNNRATIYLNEWKLDKARPDLDAAIKLGNVRAKEGLQILERLQLQ